MQVHVLVRVDMVERETGRAKRLELGADFRGEPGPDAGREEKAEAGAELISVEPSVLPHQRSRVLRGGNTGAPSIRTRCSPTRSPGRRRALITASAAAGAATIRLAQVEDAVAVRSLDRLVDGDVAPEIVGADDQPPRVAFVSRDSRTNVAESRQTGSRSQPSRVRQPAISRWRRNWKNSTPSRSRRRIICGLRIISATSEAIFCRRK